MPQDFWASSGFTALDRGPQGLVPTDAWLARFAESPELVPPADAGARERELHRRFRAAPRIPIGRDELAALEDPDARDNWAAFLRFRERVLAHPTLEICYASLFAGGVDIAPVSIPEARSLIDAGKVKSLAVFADSPPALYPNLPTVKQAVGSDWKTAAWRGFAAPKGLPKDVADRLTGVFKKAYDSKEYKDFLAQRGFGGEWADQAGFAQYMAKADADMGKVMKAVGIAK